MGTARWDGGASKRDWPVETGTKEKRKWELGDNGKEME